MAAPPDDSRFEYLDGGPAAVVDDAEYFDPAEANRALARPWFTLRARSFSPRLLELVNALSSRDEGANLGARLAALPSAPPFSDDDPQLAEALGAFLWFLDQATDDGIPLTAAGWMRPAVVEQAAERIPQMAHLRRVLEIGDGLGDASEVL
ncbi:hypothetical protein L1785_08945 [Antribacter sp. KLBMP9083]|uniref:Uncharacterized protein n=1 Tax=Antribacter soli TaxID=2910976 RepID=A0AA41U6J5_9MICO|nr:hypothetical protein [Antribacter soli]MCF4121108.1 hypothetical protein [Antribacter soli]